MTCVVERGARGDGRRSRRCARCRRAREAVIAVLVAAVGAIATVGFEPVDLAGPLRVHHPRPVAGRRAVPRLPARRRPARARPPRHPDRRRSAACLLARHPRVRRAAAPLRHPRPGRVALRRRPLVAGQPRRVPAADRGACSASPRWPGAATCGPGAARAGGCARSASRPPHRSPTALLNTTVTPHRGGARGAVRRGGRPGGRLSLIRADLALTGPAGRRGPPRRGGDRRPARSRSAPVRCSEPACTRPRGRDSNPRLTSLPATAFRGGADRPIGTALKAVAGRDVSRGFESRPLCWCQRLLGAAQLELDLVVRQVVQPLEVVGDVGEQPLQVDCGPAPPRGSPAPASPSR